MQFVKEWMLQILEVFHTAKGNDTIQLSKKAVESLSKMVSHDISDQSLVRDLEEFLSQMRQMEIRVFGIIYNHYETKSHAGADKPNSKPDIDIGTPFKTSSQMVRDTNLADAKGVKLTSDHS